MKLTILASGSGGNCALVESETCALLVDAGLSARKITARLAELGQSIENIGGILLTHEHSDHTQGLTVLANRKQIPVFANELTWRALANSLQRCRSWQVFETGKTFTVGDFTVQSFSVPHDAYDPVGFSIADGTRKAVFLTDLGYATHLAIERAREADAVVLEANHDPELLRADTRRPWATKQRILTRHGHLSNESAAEVAAQIASPRLRHLILAHLSEDCNRPEIALQTVQERLAREGHAHVQVYAADPSVGLDPLEL